jgi:predicted DNA-binding transcriptional regulator YafY
MKTKEIADALGVSERMVRKYMIDLIEANINIESISGPTGGYELKGYDYLLNLDLSKEESVALEMATKKLKESKDFILPNQLESLKDKIKILNENRNKYEDYSDNNVIKPMPLSIEKSAKFELELQAACISRNKVKIKYESISSGYTTRIIKPYGIITRNNQKYLIAFCEKREKILTFKLSRIEYIEILNIKFIILEEFNMRKFMKNHLGLFNDETLHIKLLISKPFSKSVSEGIYAKNQSITESKDGSIIFEGEMSGKTDIIRWILSMRTSVTVLEPKELKEEIKNELKKMLNTI